MQRSIMLGSFAVVFVACGGLVESAPNRADKATSPLLADVTVVDLSAGAPGSAANGVNAAGVAVGYRSIDGVRRAARWENAAAVDLHPSGALSSEAMAINDGGDIVGKVVRDGAQARLAVWGSGGDEPLEIATPGAGVGLRVFVSASREVSGEYGPSGTSRGFFWSAAAGMVDIGTLGGTHTIVRAMNQTGHVIGRSTTAASGAHAFLWRAGTMTDLGTLTGAVGFSDGQYVNDNGVAVGMSRTSSGINHAFRWENGIMVDLDPSGVEESGAFAINNAGTIAGYRTIGGQFHATIWRDGHATDLGAGAGSLAEHINEWDVVAGNRYYAPGRNAYVWQDAAQGPVDLLPPPGASVSLVVWLGSHDAVGGTTSSPRAAQWPITIVAPSSNEQLGGLQENVSDLEASGAISSGISSSLASKLEGALRQCERGNANAARNQIRAFIHHVDALVASGTLTSADGAALIDEAERILASLSC